MGNAAETLQILEPCAAASALLGVANYTAAARLAAKISGSTTAAAKMSILRWRDASPKPCIGFSCEPLLRLLASTRVELREGIVVITVSKSSFSRLEPLLKKLMLEARLFHVAQGISSVTLIIDEEHSRDIRRAAGEVVEEIMDQSAIILVSPREILETPGFVAYISALLAINSINITQVVSCHTDTILILSSKVAGKAYELLGRAVKLAKSLLEAGVLKGEEARG